MKKIVLVFLLVFGSLLANAQEYFDTIQTEKMQAFKEFIVKDGIDTLINLDNVGDIIKAYEILDMSNNKITNIATPTQDQDGANKIYVDNLTQNFQNIINVDQGGAGEFTTITAALASITTASPINTFLILVNPGIYVEQLVGKDYVTVLGVDDDLVTVTNGTPPIWQPSANKSSIRDISLICTGTSSGFVVQSSAGIGVSTAENKLQQCDITFTTSTPGVSGGLIDINSDGLLIIQDCLLACMNNNAEAFSTGYIFKYAGDLKLFYDTNILNCFTNQTAGDIIVIDNSSTDVTTLSNSEINMTILNASWNDELFGWKINNSNSVTKFSLSVISKLTGAGNGTLYATYANTGGTSRVDLNTTTFKMSGFAQEYFAYAATAGDQINGYFANGEADAPAGNGTFGDVNKVVIQNGDFLVNTAVIDENMFINDATLRSLNDFFKTVASAGWAFGGDITDNEDGTVNISSGYGFIRTSNSEQAPIVMFDWSAANNILLTDNSANYIKLIYNAGNPILALGSSAVYDNENDEFELYEIYREGFSLHITKHFHRAKNVDGEIQKFLYEVLPIWYINGLQGSDIGTRNISTTAGRVRVKLNQIDIPAINTLTGDTLDRYYLDGIGGFTKTTGETQWDNLQYDDGDGTLATMTTNRWSFQDFYIETDGDLISLYGRDQYITQSEAQNAPPLSPIPSRLDEHALRAFRIVFQKNAATGTVITYLIKGQPSSVTGGIVVTDHGELAGLEDDDHPRYLLGDGTRAMTGDLTVNSTGAIKTASGTTAERPASSVNGMWRYDTDLSKNQMYEGVWKNVITSTTEVDLSNYTNKTANETITGNWDFNNPVTVADPILRTDAATLGTVQDAVMGLSWQQKVINFFDPTSGLPITPSEGDRYISSATANGWTDNYIYEYRETTWYETPSLDGFAVFINTTGSYYSFDSVNWVEFSVSPSPHASTHQNSGADEITVEGLNGILVEDQKTATDATLTGTGVSGSPLSVDKTGDWTGTFDGQEGSYYLNRQNHTGQQLASTISDFDAEVSNNTDVDLNNQHRLGSGSDHSDVALNTTHRTSDGSDHTYLNQSVITTSNPTFNDINSTGVIKIGSPVATVGDLRTEDGGLSLSNPSNNNWSVISNTGASTNSNLVLRVGTGDGVLINSDKSVNVKGLLTAESAISTTSISSSGLGTFGGLITTVSGASDVDGEVFRFNRSIDTNRYNSIFSKSSGGGLATMSFKVHDGVTGTSQITALTLKGDGNATFAGSVTATSFSGNGSGVTNVNATQLGGIVAANYWHTGNSGTSAYDWAAKDIVASGLGTFGNDLSILNPTGQSIFKSTSANSDASTVYENSVTGGAWKMGRDYSESESFGIAWGASAIPSLSASLLRLSTTGNLEVTGTVQADNVKLQTPQTVTYASTVNIDVSAYKNHNIALTGDITITLTNGIAGDEGFVYMTADASRGVTVTHLGSSTAVQEASKPSNLVPKLYKYYFIDGANIYWTYNARP